MNWNTNQLKAITTYNDSADQKRANILVNAAAGSGKTAVLVERIIRRIENGGDVSRLLVVTFTRAAAAEMQQRIHNALAKLLDNTKEEKKREHLVRQLDEIQRADICNIDSYCMDFVKNNFHLLGIDPSVSPVSGGELEMMKEEAVYDVIEKSYAMENNDAFLRAAECFGTATGDSVLADMILDIYNFISAMPEPFEWLDNVSSKLEGLEAKTFFKEEIEKGISLAAQILSFAADSVIELAYDAFDENGGELRKKYGIENTAALSEEEKIKIASDIVNENPYDKVKKADDNPLIGRWGNVWTLAADDFAKASELSKADAWNLAGTANNIKLKSTVESTEDIKYAKFKTEYKRAEDKDLLSAVNVRHEQIQENINRIKENVPLDGEGDIDVLNNYVSKDIKEICRLVKSFTETLDEMKKKRSVMEFGDIERCVYRVMRENEDIRSLYREKYDEILIDEYQDVNRLQDAIFETISNGSNMFMVGDMKQSIYRFRRSDPTIFKNKSERYEKEGSTVINLNENYRSRGDVLESINDVFKLIMHEETAELEYDDTQRLNAGRSADTYIDINNSEDNDISDAYMTDNRSELVVIKPDEESGLSAREAEAEYVADKIKSMIDSGFKVWRRTELLPDGSEKQIYGAVEARDFAILSYSVRGVYDIYEKALAARGISLYAESGGYFEKNEIKDTISFIKMTDNPTDDISFTACATSRVCGFTDDELARIRLLEGSCMYDRMKRMAYREEEDGLPQKCERFLKMIRKWRRLSHTVTCESLILTIYGDTHMYAYAGTQPHGKEIQANMRKIADYARKFEKSGYRGLFSFIRFLEKMKLHDSETGEAKQISENHNVVRMMTIHKSKGLEFPVVFLINSSRDFTKKIGKTPQHCCSADQGIGLNYVNPDGHYSVPTVIKKRIDKEEKEKLLAEQMRLLYVGMTRAREKLIITAAGRDNLNENLYTSAAETNLIKQSKSFYEWTAPAAIDSERWISRNGVTTVYNDNEAVLSDTDKEGINKEEFEAMRGILNWNYKYEAAALSPAKISVTELKRRKAEEEDMKQLVYAADDDDEAAEEDTDTSETDYTDEALQISENDDKAKESMNRNSYVRLDEIPSFLEKRKKPKPSEIGTAAHLVMQTLASAQSADEVEEHIQKLAAQNHITQREANALNSKKLFKFYTCELAKRRSRSEKVYNELPFAVMLDSMDVYGYEGDEVVLQGIIDCCFEENGEFVLIDYKTDYYKKGEADTIVKRYKEQLDRYAAAIEVIMKKRVKEKYLYLLYHGETAECK